jgi:hypothetical protein
MSQKPEVPPNIQLIIHLCREFPALQYLGQIRFSELSIPILEPPECTRICGIAADDQLVNLDQIAAMARRRKRTMRDYRKEMPPPTVKGTGSIPDLWDWSIIRPWLMETFRLPKLPEKFPRF